LMKTRWWKFDDCVLEFGFQCYVMSKVISFLA
jgi:hypothetical protein